MCATHTLLNYIERNGFMANMDLDFTTTNPMPKVGYAFVPMQVFKETYSPDKALIQGTVFPELDISMAEYGKQYSKEDNDGNK